jgi:uncharacterized protein (DUF885 family)
VNLIHQSRAQYVRELFDLMPTEGEEGAVNIARRMAAVPEAYRQFSRTLLDAARNGRPPARLQVEEVARQCANWSNPEDSFYSGLVEQLTGVPDSLRGELDAAARAATAATAGPRPQGERSARPASSGRQAFASHQLSTLSARRVFQRLGVPAPPSRAK